MELNTEEQIADEAAFEAAFASDRGEEAPAPTEPIEPVVPAEPAPDAQVEPTVPPVEPPKLIAGLTEEQLQAALARNTSLQGTVDKMAGRLGQLMQQIETLRTAPATPAAAAKLDLKLEKLGESSPELANLLREDLAAAGAAPVEPAAPVATGITQEELDARLAGVTEKTNEIIEVKVLGIMHPDWQQVIRTPQFALWRDTVLPAGDGVKLMESQDASEISKGLTQFKEWIKPATQPAPPAPPTPPAPPAPPRANRLANAVLPNGGAAPAPVAELSEEAAFAASFAAEQKRRGM
jgi:hypothetical protein